MSSSHDSATPAAKRRRVEVASATLRKPFRTPLLSRSGASAGVVGSPSPSPSPSSPCPAETISARQGLHHHHKPVRTTTASPLVRASTTRTGTTGSLPITPCKNPTPASATSARKTTRGAHQAARNSKSGSGSDLSTEENDLLTQLHRAQQAVDARLRDARAELDVVRQARRLEDDAARLRSGSGSGSGPGTRSRAQVRREVQDSEEEDEDEDEDDEKEQPMFEEGGGEIVIGAELRALAGKWRGASRVAAEELFELVKGRVDSMGGAKAWRETRVRGRGEWEDGFGGSGGGGGVGDKRNRDEDEGGDERDQGEGEEEHGDEDKEADDGETEFTMLMMLKSLNIDPDELGYDPVEDRWRD